MTSKRKESSMAGNLGNIVEEVEAADAQTSKRAAAVKESGKIKQLTVRMPAELHKRLEQYRVDSGQTMVATAIEAIAEYLEKHEVRR